MPIQDLNAEQIGLLAAHFPLRNGPEFAWGNAISGFLYSQNLRAFWPGSSVDENGSLYDISGQGRLLAAGTLPTFTGYGLASYVDFNAAASQYLQRPTEPGLVITDALSIWTWIRFDAPSTGVPTYPLGKWLNAGNQMGYMLVKTAADVLEMWISNTGAAAISVNDGGVNYATGKWFFLGGRFIPGSELALFVGNATTGAYNWYRLVTAAPSIFNSNAEFSMGRSNGGSYLDGQMSLSGLSAAAYSDTYFWNMFSQTRPLFMNW